MKKVRLFISTILVLSFVLFENNKVFANGIPFGISPENPEISYFDFTIHPGESVQDAIILKNFSDKKIYLQVKAVDAKTGMNGGLAYDFENKVDYSKWITLEKEDNILLSPYNMDRIGFSVSVPVGTLPGEYVVGFISSLVPATPTPVSPSESASGYMIDVITRVAITMVIHVPGPEKCSLELSQMEASVFDAQWRYSIVVHNSGNVHFMGTQKLTIKDFTTGEIITTNSLSIGYVAPNTTMKSRVSLSIPDPGEYEYSIEYQDRNRPSCKFSFTGTTEFAQPEQNLLATQSTLIAEYKQESTKAPPIIITAPTTGIEKDIKTPGTTTWYIWISGVIFLISVGLVIYALSILKRSKK
jgi:hypothetical protein